MILQEEPHESNDHVSCTGFRAKSAGFTNVGAFGAILAHTVNEYVGEFVPKDEPIAYTVTSSLNEKCGTEMYLEAITIQ